MKGIKKIHILGILMVGVAIALLFSASKDLSTYATFAQADQVNRSVKVVGVLAKDKEMYYNPEDDPNYFSFFVKDGDGEERKVILHDAKPQDFELSEQIVVTGKMKDDVFVASSLLMKCPSKYKDEEIAVRKDI
ncbi:MAG: cytochrome c maturation protein CcmE [Saprospiraceae bacterium]|nr:cytochrome c maturation protein CcmE [Saprospiraceae bacterium]